MKNGIASIERIEDYRLYDDIVDVRSPGEFADDHIPGAINCPVLDDAQRVEVGTLYKQDSPFVARRIGAAYVAHNIARHLQEKFHARPPSWRPLIVCWRGGQRSGAMTLVFRRIGWNAEQLHGGYKHYRKLVIARLAEVPGRLSFKVVCGATGSGKSRILKSLAARGEQVLDLEELAAHKGSVLGVLPDARQPSQKSFETRLIAALLEFDPARPVYVEAESRKIGTLQVPDPMLEAMRRGACVHINASFAARVEFLLRDYDYFVRSPDWLNARLATLTAVQGRPTIDRWQAYARAAQWSELVGELLELHYDPLYRRSQSHNFAGFGNSREFVSDDLSDRGIDALAERILAG